MGRQRPVEYGASSRHTTDHRLSGLVPGHQERGPGRAHLQRILPTQKLTWVQVQLAAAPLSQAPVLSMHRSQRRSLPNHL